MGAFALLVAGAVGAQSPSIAPGAAPLPGGPTAEYVIEEFAQFLSRVHDAHASDAKATGQTLPDDACFVALAAFDPKPQTETLRQHLVSTIDARTLAAHDAFASTEAFKRYVDWSRTLLARLFASPSSELKGLADDPSALPSDEVVRQGQLPEYKALHAVINDDQVWGMLQRALLAAMPAGCGDPAPDVSGRQPPAP